jgi:hypothetical protein
VGVPVAGWHTGRTTAGWQPATAVGSADQGYGSLAAWRRGRSRPWGRGEAHRSARRGGAASHSSGARARGWKGGSMVAPAAW